MCVTSLLCGPRANLWPFYGFLCKRFSLYIKLRNKPQNVLNISRDTSNVASDTLSTQKKNCVCLMKSLKNMLERLKTVTVVVYN